MINITDEEMKLIFFYTGIEETDDSAKGIKDCVKLQDGGVEGILRRIAGDDREILVALSALCIFEGATIIPV